MPHSPSAARWWTAHLDPVRERAPEEAKVRDRRPEVQIRVVEKRWAGWLCDMLCALPALAILRKVYVPSGGWWQRQTCDMPVNEIGNLVQEQTL